MTPNHNIRFIYRSQTQAAFEAQEEVKLHQIFIKDTDLSVFLS